MTGNPLRHILVLVTILLTVTVPVWADISITSIANPVEVSSSGRIAVTITVSGSDALRAGSPILDDTQEFTVVGPSGTSQQISIMNGQTSVTKIFRYSYIPTHTGTFTIGGAKVVANGTTYQTKGTQVTVVDGQPSSQTMPPPSAGASSRQAGSAGDENLFVRATTDKTEVFVGEQVTYTFEFFSRISNIHDTEYQPPSTTGFWSVTLPEIPASTRTVDNKFYRVNTLKSALFPTTSGNFTIGPATLDYTIGGFFSALHARSLETNAIDVTVKPLPEEGKPDNFSGAVGRYNISAAIDRMSLTTTDVATIQVTVTGTGNLDLVTGLDAPDLSGFRSYDPKITAAVSNSGFRVGGGKTWEYVLMPLAPGDITIGSFSLSYFDPAAGKYRTATTDPVTLTVTPGVIASNANSPTAGDPDSGEPGQDIRYIKPDRATLSSVKESFYTHPLFFGMYLLPLGIFISAFLLKRRRDAIEQNTGLKRRMHAWKHARNGLEAAESLEESADIAKFCGVISDTVTNYLADMLNIHDSVLTTTTIEQIANDHNISTELSEQMRKMLELCDFARFSSLGTATDIRRTLLNDARDICNHLRKELDG